MDVVASIMEGRQWAESLSDTGGDIVGCHPGEIDA